MNIFIEEKPTGDFQIGLSFGSLNGAAFVTGLREKNIGGTGRNVKFYQLILHLIIPPIAWVL